MTLGTPSRPGPKVAFFTHFTYKKMPPGDLFSDFHIFSPNHVRFGCDGYVRRGQSAETKGKWAMATSRVLWSTGRPQRR